MLKKHVSEIENQSYLFFGSTVIIFTFSALQLPIFFEENDDVVMMMLASGQYSGEPSSYLVFSNYFYAFLLSKLYTFAPLVPWYSSFILLSLSCCLSLLLTDSFRYIRAANYWALSTLALLTLFLVSFILNMQFTTTAGASVAIGGWASVSYEKRLFRFIGALLVFLGFMLRFEAGVLAMLVSMPIYLMTFVYSPDRRRSFIALLGVLVLVIIAEVASNLAYQDIDRDYFLFNEYRGQINDNPNARMIVDKLPFGISQNDYNLLLAFFVDPVEVSESQIAQISQALSEFQSGFTLTDYASSFAKIASQKIFLAIIFFTLIFIFLMKREKSSALFIIFSLLILMAVFTYVQLTATLKNRVVYVATFSLISAVFYVDQPLKGGRLLVASIIASVPLLVLLVSMVWEAKHDTEISKRRFANLINTISEWNGDVIIHSSAAHLQDAQLFTSDVSRLAGKIALSGWMAGHPNNSWNGHLDLLEDGTVILFRLETWSRYLEPILTGLTENYEIEPRFVVEKVVGDLILVSIRADVN